MNKFNQHLLLNLILMITTILANRSSQVASDGNVTTGPAVVDEGLYLKKLRSELLSVRQYDKWSRPVKNHATQTKVDMRITINEFIELDTVYSILLTDAWFHISWKDEHLTWDPNDYGQLKQIHFGAHELWKPDIVLINTADQDNMLGIFSESDIVVNSTGDVTWITTSLLKSKCPMSAKDYPFVNKAVNCQLTFCSLIYQASEVNMTTPPEEFLSDGPWFINEKLEIINVTGTRYERHFEDYGTYSFESLKVKLKRKDSSFSTIVRVPTLVAYMLVLCMFFMPVVWAIRIQLALYAIIIQLLLILFVGNQLGVNAIGLAKPIAILRADLALSCTALILTLVMRVMLMKAESMPQLPYVVSSLLVGPIARLLCFGINQNGHISGDVGRSKIVSEGILPTVNPYRRANLSEVSTVGQYTSDSSAAADMERLTTSDDDGSPSDGQQSFAIHLGNGAPMKMSSSQQEWMLITIFCDRILFVIYACTMIPGII